MSGRIEQIRAAHLSARPNPAVNPAWANSEHDIGVLLAEIDKLRAALEPFVALLHRLPMAADHVEIAALNGDLCDQYVDQCLSLTVGDFRHALDALSGSKE